MDEYIRQGWFCNEVGRFSLVFFRKRRVLFLGDISDDRRDGHAFTSSDIKKKTSSCSIKMINQDRTTHHYRPYHLSNQANNSTRWNKSTTQR